MNQMESYLDPFGIASSLLKVHESWMRSGPDLFNSLAKLSSDIQCANAREIIPLLFESCGSKETFDDPEGALLKMVKNYSKLSHKVHAAYSSWLREYVGRAEGIEEEDRRRSAFWANQIINAISPANCFWTNPSAVQKFVRSRGESIANGLRNWLDDVNRGDNLVTIADMDAFKVGENLATTSGHVIFRNNLMELIQYAPTRESRFAVPVVFIPPWINKFYIFDLTEEKSIVRYLLDQGFSVFMISWRNPPAEMHDVTFEDYMFHGALKAVEVAREICGAEQADAVGYCIGGTLLTVLMAWLNRGTYPEGRCVPIRRWTLFASMVDYSEPGEVGVYISESAIEKVEELANKDGYLDGRYMALAFRLLRSDSLWWRYHAHNYLQGDMPPKSDFLYWNSDSTRLPAAMCSYYLREFYLLNNLVKKDQLLLGHRPIDIGRIRQPLYAVGAEQDHICPWRETFKVCNLVGGPARYTLSAEGHITGIINPPSPRSRKKFRTSETVEPLEADEWFSACSERQGSWWVDWAGWLAEGSESTTEPPSAGNEKYPPLDKAPGVYVLEQ